ncbi:MAG: twin-arginine translocase TatA/TatE family subunit [Mucilaginibacter sp.]|nr:twin-arginine translocase TatA/TatE family subunit [Mucilaginibacter sp.]
MFSSALLFLDIGGPELMLILFVALLLFGGDKLPELARGLGKGIRDFKDASDGVKREIANQIDSYENKKTDEPAAVTESLPPHEGETIVNPDHLVEGPEANAIPAGYVANTIPAGESHTANDKLDITPVASEGENHSGTANVSTEGSDKVHEQYKL